MMLARANLGQIVPAEDQLLRLSRQRVLPGVLRLLPSPSLVPLAEPGPGAAAALSGRAGHPDQERRGRRHDRRRAIRPGLRRAAQRRTTSSAMTAATSARRASIPCASRSAWTASADVQFVGVTLLDSDAATPGVQPYDMNDSDTEEILLLPDDTLLISSERDRAATRGCAASRSTAACSRTGRFQILPARLTAGCAGPQVQTRGVRSNLGFEGVTLAPDESALYVMNEEALAQDGSIATPASGTNVRLLRYSLSSGTPVRSAGHLSHREDLRDADPAGPVRRQRRLGADVHSPSAAAVRLPGHGAQLRHRGRQRRQHLRRQYRWRDRRFQPARTARAVRRDARAEDPAGQHGLAGHRRRQPRRHRPGPAARGWPIALLVISDDNFSDTQFNQFLLFSVAAPAGK